MSVKLRGEYDDIIFFIFSAAVNSETREEVAIKKIGNAFDNIIDARRTLREIKLLRHMEHENVSSASGDCRDTLNQGFQTKILYIGLVSFGMLVFILCLHFIFLRFIL